MKRFKKAFSKVVLITGRVLLGILCVISLFEIITGQGDYWSIIFVVDGLAELGFHLLWKYRMKQAKIREENMAHKQYLYFSNPENGYINGEVLVISSAEDIENIANNEGVQQGDLLYFSKDGITVHHATIITKVEDGMIYFADPTSPQYDCALSNKLGTETVFIIKTKEDA